MPSSTMTHEDQWKLPKDVPLPATLVSVSEKEIPYTNKDGKPDKFVKWEWEFQISDGDYAGLKAWGDTEPRLTNREDNKVRQWAEAIRQAPFEMGEGLDTDDLLGLPCTIVVDNTTYTKKGSTETSYLCPVTSVIESGVGLEPPF